jgi:DNA-binding XRE family transcriptional regulator
LSIHITTFGDKIITQCKAKSKKYLIFCLQFTIKWCILDITGGEVMKISLRAARVNAGLTQKQAAIKLGITTPTLFHYETGETMPDAKVLILMADLYGISLDDINFCPANTIKKCLGGETNA